MLKDVATALIKGHGEGIQQKTIEGQDTVEGEEITGEETKEQAKETVEQAEETEEQAEETVEQAEETVEQAEETAEQAEGTGEEVENEESEEEFEEEGAETDSEEEKYGATPYERESDSGDENNPATTEKGKQIQGYFRQIENEGEHGQEVQEGSETVTQQAVIRQFKQESASSSRIDTEDEARLKANMQPTNSLFVQLDQLNLVRKSKSSVKNFVPTAKNPRIPIRPPPAGNQQPANSKSGPKPAAKQTKKGKKPKAVDERLEAAKKMVPNDPKTPSPSSNKYHADVGGFGTPGAEPECAVEDNDEHLAKTADANVQKVVSSSIVAALNTRCVEPQTSPPAPSSFIDMTELMNVIKDLEEGTENEAIKAMAFVTGLAIQNQTKVTMAALESQQRSTDMVSKIN
jgi:hypothetical protein